jgi:hypothetical protein
LNRCFALLERARRGGPQTGSGKVKPVERARRDIDDKSFTTLFYLRNLMSLAAASEARKARLLALRKKRTGEDVEDSPYVPHVFALGDTLIAHTPQEGKPMMS